MSHFLFQQVGVLTSHVHSIVMSSNGMEGRIPSSIAQLTYLRMIELATMPGNFVSLCSTLSQSCGINLLHLYLFLTRADRHSA